MRRRLAMFATAALLAPGAARADAVADFYRGKTVTIYLSAGAGGGYATYMQAFAPFFSRYIPGNPLIVHPNMPGAGGLRARFYCDVCNWRNATHRPATTTTTSPMAK